ncbi:MAG: PQQ-binding-like beta-propeller repeat protein [Anaerolineales bacterium]
MLTSASFNRLLARCLWGSAVVFFITVSWLPLVPRPPRPEDGEPVEHPSATRIAPQATGSAQLYLPTVFRDYPNYEWAQLNGNPQRTGYVPKEINAPWRVKWIWNGPAGGGDGGAASGHLLLPKNIQPIMGNGRLYIGHSDGRMRAISQATGQQLWVSPQLEGQIVNTAAYDAATDSVYVGMTGGRFYRLNAATGQEIFSNRPGGQIQMAPLLVGDTVYIGSTTGDLYAFDKTSLTPRWLNPYNAGAALIGSPAYSASDGGLIILLAEDGSVHAIRTSDGTRKWRVTVNADADARRGNTRFADTFPVVSDVNGVVIVRSYLVWDKLWNPIIPPTTLDAIRTFLTNTSTARSFFVLNLSNGSSRFVAPVLVGAIGNGGDFESVSPEVVVKRLSDGSEVAYLLWRNGQSCAATSSCDPRDDTTLGEMDLQTGNIRFVQDYKGQGNIRFPSDEQGPLTMAGDTLFHTHWASLSSVRITNRSASYGSSYANPIRTVEGMLVLNTLAAGSCPGRSNHSCPQGMYDPGGVYTDPGFYLYYAAQNVYDQLWATPVRGATIGAGVVYWRSVDGAIMAVGP